MMYSRARKSQLPTPVKQACDSCRVHRIRCEPLSDSESPGLQEASQATYSPCKRCAQESTACTFSIPVRPKGRRSKQSKQAVATLDTPFCTNWRLPSYNSALEELTPENRENEQPPVFSELSDSDGLEPRTFQSDSSRLYPQESPLGADLSTTYHDPAVYPCESFRTDRICSRPVFERIMRDWLTLMYPLSPIVHRPTFEADLRAGRENSDPLFFSLVTSMCAIVTAVTPSVYEKYREQDESFRRRSRLEMVEHCQKIIMELREPDYLDQSTHEKWSVSFLIGAAFGSLGYLNRALMFGSEADHHMRRLGYHVPLRYSQIPLIEGELRKRAFWLTSFGFIHESILFADTRYQYCFEDSKIEQLIPLEVDDEFIANEGVATQQADDAIPVLAGFNILARIFHIAAPVFCDFSPGGLSHGLSHGLSPQGFTPSQQDSVSTRLKLLQQRFDKLQCALDDVREEFRPYYTGSRREPAETSQTMSSPQTQLDTSRSYYHIQRVNILVSHQWLQCLILEEIYALSTKLSGPSISHEQIWSMWKQREDICRQMLQILQTHSLASIECNGSSLIYKVRVVASTLLDCPLEADHPTTVRVKAYIDNFTKFLSKFDATVSPQLRAAVSVPSLATDNRSLWSFSLALASSQIPSGSHSSIVSVDIELLVAMSADRNAQAAEEAKKMLAELQGEAAAAPDDVKEANGAVAEDASKEAPAAEDDAAEEEQTAETKARAENPRDRRGGRDSDGRGRGQNGFKPRNFRNNIKSDVTTQEESSDPVAIRKQVEFYFSDSNLPNDKFLLSKVGGSKNNPVELGILHTFKRMRHFQPFSAIVEAMRESTFLELTDDDTCVRRREPLPESLNDGPDPSAFQVFEDRAMPRSIYAKGFGEEAPSTQFDIEAFFAPYGPTNAVRLRRTDTKSFKGSVFVEFETEELAQKFLALDPKPQFKGKDLQIMSKKEYCDKKVDDLKSGKIKPNDRRGFNRGDDRRGRDNKRKRGDDDRDWRTRRDEDRKHGFRDDKRHGGRDGKGGRGRDGRSDRRDHRRSDVDNRDRGIPDIRSTTADEDKPKRETGHADAIARAKAAVEAEAKKDADAAANKKRAREDDAAADTEREAKKVDSKAEPEAAAANGD